MARRITNLEFKRRVFNEALLECMCKIHGEILNGDSGCDCTEDARLSDMAAKMCSNFFRTELNLDKSTIGQTRANIAEAVSFIQDCANISEDIAEDKAEEAKECDMEICDDQKIELSDEDHDVIDQLFDVKNPELQVEKVRDATVKALLAEDKKAQEIKDAVDIAQSQVAAGAPASTMEETVNRINGRGPTSLMNAIITNVTQAAIQEVMSVSKTTSVGKIMSENADEIKSRAVMAYSLFEMAQVFGIATYDKDSIAKLSREIYYGA